MRKLLLLSVIAAQSAFGYASYSGFCEQGGVKVSMQGMTSNNTFQQSYPNATQSGAGPSVTVYITGTTTKAAIFSNNTGTTKANPFPCTTAGQYLFFAQNGTYDLLFSGTGISSFTRGSVNIGDHGTDIGWFGARNDFNELTGVGTDNCAALTKAFAPGGEVFAQSTGLYYSSCGVTLNSPTNIHGASSGINPFQSPSEPSTAGVTGFVFPAGVQGFTFEEASYGSSMRDIYIKSLAPAGVGAKDCVQVHSQFFLAERLTLVNCERDGLHVGDSGTITDNFIARQNNVYGAHRDAYAGVDNSDLNASEFAYNISTNAGRWGYNLGALGGIATGNYSQFANVGNLGGGGYLFGHISVTSDRNVCEGGTGGTMTLTGGFITVINPLAGGCIVSNQGGPSNKVYQQGMLYEETLRLIPRAGTHVYYVAPSSGSGTAYTGASVPVMTSYTNGDTVTFIADVANTPGPVTLKVGALAAVPVLGQGCSGPNLAAGDFNNDGIPYNLIYSSSNGAFCISGTVYSMDSATDGTLTIRDVHHHFDVATYNYSTGVLTLGADLRLAAIQTLIKSLNVTVSGGAMKVDGASVGSYQFTTDNSGSGEFELFDVTNSKSLLRYGPALGGSPGMGWWQAPWRVYGTIDANTSTGGTGYSVDGAAGLSVTKTVRNSAGTGTCTLVFTGGILTGGTC